MPPSPTIRQLIHNCFATIRRLFPNRFSTWKNSNRMWTASWAAHILIVVVSRRSACQSSASWSRRATCSSAPSGWWSSTWSPWTCWRANCRQVSFYYANLLCWARLTIAQLSRMGGHGVASNNQMFSFSWAAECFFDSSNNEMLFVCRARKKTTKTQTARRRITSDCFWRWKAESLGGERDKLSDAAWLGPVAIDRLCPSRVFFFHLPFHVNTCRLIDKKAADRLSPLHHRERPQSVLHDSLKSEKSIFMP